MQHVWMPHVCFESIEWLYKHDMKLYNHIYMVLSFLSEFFLEVRTTQIEVLIFVQGFMIFVRSYGK